MPKRYGRFTKAPDAEILAEFKRALKANPEQKREVIEHLVDWPLHRFRPQRDYYKPACFYFPKSRVLIIDVKASGIDTTIAGVYDGHLHDIARKFGYEKSLQNVKPGKARQLIKDSAVAHMKALKARERIRAWMKSMSAAIRPFIVGNISPSGAPYNMADFVIAVSAPRNENRPMVIQHGKKRMSSLSDPKLYELRLPTDSFQLFKQGLTEKITQTARQAMEERNERGFAEEFMVKVPVPDSYYPNTHRIFEQSREEILKQMRDGEHEKNVSIGARTTAVDLYREPDQVERKARYFGNPTTVTFTYGAEEKKDENEKEKTDPLP